MNIIERQEQIDRLNVALNELNQFPGKFQQAKRDIQNEIYCLQQAILLYIIKGDQK